MRRRLTYTQRFLVRISERHNSLARPARNLFSRSRESWLVIYCDFAQSYSLPVLKVVEVALRSQSIHGDLSDSPRLTRTTDDRGAGFRVGKCFVPASARLPVLTKALVRHRPRRSE